MSRPKILNKNQKNDGRKQNIRDCFLDETVIFLLSR